MFYRRTPDVKRCSTYSMKRITFYSTVGVIAFFSFFIIILSTKHCKVCFSTSAMAIKFFAVGLVTMGGSLYFKKKFLETEEIIFNVESEPILHTDEATDEVPFAGEGVIENKEGQILRSPYTDTPCVYYHSVTEKLVHRGKSSHWEIVSNIAHFVPFYLKDEKGKLEIDPANMDDDFSAYDIPLPEDISDPDNSEIDCEALLKNQNYSESKPGFLGLSASTKFRRSEYVLKPGTKVFVYGGVKKKNGQLFLHEDMRCPLIISKKSHDQYVEDFYRGASLVYLAPALMSIGYIVSLFSADHFFRWDPVSFWLLFLIGNGIITGSFLFSLYNRIIAFRQRALNAESNIDAELARRTELIPQLTETVKGYSAHEREIQEIVAESRAQKTFSAELLPKTSAVMPGLAVVIENYPTLKASTNFQALMGTLIDTENRISYSREFYNRNIRKYNSLIGRFPYLLVSYPLNMKEMEYISILHKENSVPQVLV